ncbi:hypothetical protein FIA58_016015 [Flavobacterium jejuense]|uniref:Lipoprotein n=1 Tax=Flavobacterium jejuense TaxID=1544455 RepID=A0ABX0IZK5_9FLAO|nr:hypothetical protein [Flavobacterium jejuense]NHN27189.1 hypothetical protein [Flavobacterium jejuense]
MRYMFVLITCLLIFGCSSIQQKDKLFGNWSSINSSNEIDLEFYDDSLIIEQWGVRNNFRWDIDNSYIYFDSLKIDKNKKKICYNYKLVNDTLLLRKNKDEIDFLKLVRINNAFEYFNKSLNLNLPIKSNLSPVLNEETAYILYALYDKNKVILKTSNNIFLSFDDLKRNINLHIANTELDDVSKINVMLFADKRVSKVDILKIKSIIKNINNMKVYQIFTNKDVDYKKIDWKQNIKWYGILN